ncbi:MAG TPA: glycogen debranching N-terminal domain-containing protein [Chloroflexia bacterium]|nr:glycogen debranching N-terminal domain-containing protein [Chloroflexia bacterium]
MTSLNQQLVLKEGDVFVVTDETGDILGNEALGLYYHDTRHLSLFSLWVNGQKPPLLSFSGYRNFMGTLQYANDIIVLGEDQVVSPQTISIRRSRFISEGLHERVGFVNYNPFEVPLSLTLSYAADFRDIFDVRGFPRDKWGELLPPLWEDGTLTLRYSGLDGVTRSTLIPFETPPDSVEIVQPESTEPVIEPGIMLPVVGAPSFHVTLPTPIARLTWNLVLQPDTPVSVSFHVMPYVYDSSQGEEQEQPPGEQSEPLAIPPPPSNEGRSGRFDRAVSRMRMSYYNWDQESSIITTDNEDFNHVLKRSRFDVRVLCDPVDDGYFPSAGIPWYACPFGRDSLVTALQTTLLNAMIGVGTLHTLARFQGEREDPWREEQPGKILHELRRGEMARLGWVPHSPYFGSVDATPLFVMLFAQTMRWLDDDRLYESLLPNALRAVEWIDTYGDVDGDGFVEYAASTSHGGIRNQVWKDSSDSIQMPDGTLAETPIAAVEVQGYVYAAKLGLSELLRRKGDTERADRLAAEAQTLKERFNQAFWMPEEGFYCQGLDRDKQQVPTISSNPGHALWCGIADEDKALQTVQRMMRPDVLSGWGIRTISNESRSYNPMSYHNGSIWPHDNSLVVAGFKRYGCHDEANEVISQIAEAAQYFRYYRLPELYCGFARDTVYGSGPSEYPVSCSPQAWAAASPVMMLQTILGLEVDAAAGQVSINPRLPDWLGSVRVSNLRVGARRVDLEVTRRDEHNEVFIDGEHEGLSLQIT